MRQTTIVRSFGRFIRTCRQARGLSRPALAQRCGLPSAYVKELERGQIAPSFRALNAIARALEMDPDDLINQAAAHNHGVGVSRLGLARIRAALDDLRARMTIQPGEDDDERKHPTRHDDHFID